MIKSNECSEERSFFSGKSLEICSRSVLIFRGLTCDFVLRSVHFHWKANSLSDGKSIKVTKTWSTFDFENGNKLSDFPAK